MSGQVPEQSPRGKIQPSNGDILYSSEPVVPGSNISLDGESLLLPPMMGGGGGDFDDDLSSLNSSIRNVSVKDSAVKVVGTASNTSGSYTSRSTTLDNELIPSMATGSETVHYDVNVNKATDDHSSYYYNNNDSSSCIPIWIRRAPLFLKTIVLVSLIFLAAAAVLVGLGVGMNNNNNDSNDKSSSASSNNVRAPTTFTVPAPTMQPITTTMAPVALTVATTSRPSASNGSVGVVPVVETTMSPSTTVPTTVATTVAPTLLRTGAPSSTPSSEVLLQTTAAPSTTPSQVLVQTAAPTAVATDDEQQDSTEITFYVTAGRFFDDVLEQAPERLQRLPTSNKGDSFLVHVGDWNSPSDETQCNEQAYQDVNALFSNSSVPTYFVPGDNEWNDCDSPDQALALWDEYLLNYETRYWEPSPYWTVERQEPTHAQNFRFVHQGAIFVGINLVAGTVQDSIEWQVRQMANLEWIDEAIEMYRDQAGVVVVFAHAAPGSIVNQFFYVPFFDRIQQDYSDLEVVLIHRNLISQTGGFDNTYSSSIPNLSVVVTQGSIWPPLRVQLDVTKGSFSIDQDRWFDELDKEE